MRGAVAVVIAAAAGAALAAASCAAPSRRLTTRVVDDPIVLPRRMTSVVISPWVRWYQPSGSRTADFGASIRYGLTDRLELTDIFSLRYAFLDDAPGSTRPHRPLSLAVQAGTRGIGYSSMEGWIFVPVLALDLQKHLAGPWTLSGGIDWTARATQKRVDVTPGYDPILRTFSRRRSAISASAGAVRQLTDHVAVSASVWVSQADDCVSPFCTWRSRGVGGGTTLRVRPWHWLSLGVGPSASYWYRPLTLPAPQDPTTPVATPPRSQASVGISGFVAFYW